MSPLLIAGQAPRLRLRRISPAADILHNVIARRAPCCRRLFVARATTNNVYFNAVVRPFYTFAASRNNIFSKILSGCVSVFDSYSSTYYITASPHQRTFVLHAAQSPNRAVARTGTRCRARKCMTVSVQIFHEVNEEDSGVCP